MPTGLDPIALAVAVTLVVAIAIVWTNIYGGRSADKHAAHESDRQTLSKDEAEFRRYILEQLKQSNMENARISREHQELAQKVVALEKHIADLERERNLLKESIDRLNIELERVRKTRKG